MILNRLDWVDLVAQLTAPHRERRAVALLRRGAALALERRRAFRLSGKVARSARGRPQGAAPAESAWHSARAETKRRLFEKVAECGEGHTLELVCRNGSCGERFTVPLGCGQAFFCPSCRKRRANQFRVDFQRKQLGLVSTAQRHGLTHRYRRRAIGGRFSEKLLTLTLPHTREWHAPLALGERGEAYTVRERVENLRVCWERFWRLFRDELRAKLGNLQSGITIENSPIGLPMPRGRAKAKDTLALFDLVSSLRVFEWTPGDDGLGNPHFPVWLFSPYLDQRWLRSLWSRAFADVCAPSLVCPLLVLDVRAAHECEGGSIANELVKYLTKDWHLTGDGAKRVGPEVFAELYTLVDGTRTRQSSQGLAHWQVPKEKSCPCCAFSSEREHWARVFVNHEAAERSAKPSELLEYPPVPGAGVAPRTRSAELRELYDTRKAAEWQSSAERRILAKRISFQRPDVASVPMWVQGLLPLKV